MVLELDRSKLTKKDNGTWELEFELKDDLYGTSFMKNSYGINLDIIYTPLPVVEKIWVPVVELNSTFEGIEVDEEEEEEEEVVLEGVFIEPKVSPTRNIASANEVAKAWN
jgi:hypothetical protein